MGNYVACGLNGAVSLKNPKAAAVVFPGGEVRRVEWPATAAELMLEAQGYFVVCAKELNLGRRVLPLSADQELEPGQVYVMLPMQPVNSAAPPETAEDAAAGPVFVRRLSVCRSRKPSLETIAEESVISTR